MLALVAFLISEMIAPPLPIRHPILELGTNKRVVITESPDSFSTFVLHLGCKRIAASMVAD